MIGPFALTIVFIVLSTVVAAFVRRRNKDKCLKDFSDDLITLEETTAKITCGKLNVDNTGLELVYNAAATNDNEHVETSYLLYKCEYPNIQALIRYHDDLSEAGKREREKELKRTYHPPFFRRQIRTIQNVFKTIRDSVMEVVNMLISQAKKASPAGAVLTSQDKHVSKMKQELIGTAGTSYEPLLEKYIGHNVICELIKGEKTLKYKGVLKEYTSEFVEIMDVDYRLREDESFRKADLVLPRKYGVIRHLGE